MAVTARARCTRAHPGSTPAGVLHRALGRGVVQRRRRPLVEPDSSPDRTPEDRLRVGERGTAFEPGDRGNIHREPATHELERAKDTSSVDSDAEHGDVDERHRHSPGRPQYRQIPSQPAWRRLTRRLYVTSETPSCPTHRETAVVPDRSTRQNPDPLNGSSAELRSLLSNRSGNLVTGRVVTTPMTEPAKRSNDRDTEGTMTADRANGSFWRSSVSLSSW